MAKDCPFYAVPEKCKMCDFAPKCLMLKGLAEFTKIMKGGFGGLGGLFGFGKGPKIESPKKES